MPTAKLVNKSNKEVKSIDFKVTGKPLPHSVSNEGINYSFEKREGSVYIYKQEP